MTTPILTTKLYFPPHRPEIVARPRLIERLNAGLHRKLTLISAPAGFGKTTLMSEWIAGCGRPAAWLSLDEGDNDPARFLAYLVAALQTIALDESGDTAAKIGERLVDSSPSPQQALSEPILTALLNEIANIQPAFVLILDDFHVLDAQPVDGAMSIDAAITFLLKHQPPQMHLVIATREDPNLPLARLRARNQLNELRSADLRFAPAEAAQFLNQTMDLQLSAEDINSLEMRTEGWIAGLQLAALSMRGREDVHEFVTAFAGDHRYIVDYLVEEVLARQPLQVREFLLQTSILDRFCAPLCAAVTGQPDSATLLESLERGNLFVIPLDDRRNWFRYHHLFADVLRAHLIDELPDQIATLNRRAAAWHAQSGARPEAIRYALAAGDFEQAAALIELAWSAMDRSRQSAAWLDWAHKLPEAMVRVRPVLSAGFAWALLDRGQLEAAEIRLQDAERWLDLAADQSPSPAASDAEMIVVDQEEFQSLSATIASARAYLALAHGDIAGTLRHARLALELLPENDYLRRGTSASLLALASWASGDLRTAEQSFAAAMNSFELADNILFAITGSFVLADLRLTLGKLRQAFTTYEQALQLAQGRGQPVLWGTADLHTGLSQLYWERNELKTAAEHLAISKTLGEKAALPRWRFRWSVAQARLKQAQGDLDGALASLEEAERHYVRGPVPDVRPIAALKARVWIAQGELAKAREWAAEQNLTPDDDLDYLHEFEHITLARLLIAQYQHDRNADELDQALGLLERLLTAAETGNRMGSVIELLVLQAIAHAAVNNRPQALEALKRSLELAEPESYVRTFIGEGNPMPGMLSAAAADESVRAYALWLLAACEAEPIKPSDQISPPAPQSLIEPLSERELEVLSLVAEGLSNREISERLFLALSTVKGHNRLIYRKLQVQRRTEAVARARELGLL